MLVMATATSNVPPPAATAKQMPSKIKYQSTEGRLNKTNSLLTAGARAIFSLRRLRKEQKLVMRTTDPIGSSSYAFEMRGYAAEFRRST
jgi:hypothetical protein